MCVSERAGQRHARSRTNERIRASAYESAGLKTAVAETSTKRRLADELNVRPAKRPRENASEFLFPASHAIADNKWRDCHGGYCSRANDSPRARAQSAGKTGCARFEVASRKTKKRESFKCPCLRKMIDNVSNL